MKNKYPGSVAVANHRQSKKTALYGGIGTIIAALCCFTPILVIALTAVGAASIIGYLDYVLLPSLAFFVVLTVYGFYRMKQPGSVPQKDECCDFPAGSGGAPPQQHREQTINSQTKE